jgi:glycosyltransferase involved in cell wall biosynthesis
VSGDRPPRVLLACDFFIRYSAGLAGGLEREGAAVTLLTRDHDLEFGGRAGAAAEFVQRLAPGVDHRRLEGRVRSPRALAGTLRMRRSIGLLRPDVVHVQEGIVNDVRLLFAARARPRRFALTFHDPSPHPGDGVTRRAIVANRALLRAAGLIFVHGERLREELVANARPKAPVVVVPHGVDAGDRRPLPERPSILFFGRMSPYKGLDVLLDALPLVWSKAPEATLTIAGAGDVDDHPALADPRVELRQEHVPDGELPGLFGAATCVALPYRQASQSGVGSLAKLHGRPMVVSDVGGLPELVGDGSGLVVPSEDPGRLAGALLEVLLDADLARRLGDAGRATAESGADWDSVAELTLEAYRRHLLPSSSGWA